MAQQATHSPAFVTRLTPEPEVKEEVKEKESEEPKSGDS